MVAGKDRKSSRQSWRTFLANHMRVSAACDFFTVPTLTFRLLYVFVVLSHDRRRIVHVNVTRHPLIVVEPEPLGLELLLQDAVLLDEGRDHVLLLPVHPARQRRGQARSIA